MRLMIRIIRILRMRRKENICIGQGGYGKYEKREKNYMDKKCGKDEKVSDEKDNKLLSFSFFLN